MDQGWTHFAIGLPGLCALATSPHSLAANRILIYGSVLGGAVIGISDGSLRATRRDLIVARSAARILDRELITLSSTRTKKRRGLRGPGRFFVVLNTQYRVPATP